MADISESVCLNHPDTPAVVRCAACGKPVCEACIVQHNGSCYCSGTCAQNAENSAGRVNEVVESRKRADKKSKIRTVIFLIIVAAIAAAAYVYYKNNKSDVDRFISKTEKQINSAAQSTKGTIQKNLPGDSTYKKNRENLVK